jgi:uncharacterized protein
VSSENGVGVVSGLWRFPVKSMGGERLQTAEVSTLGLLGDRAHALIDAETGKVVSAKTRWSKRRARCGRVMRSGS